MGIEHKYLSGVVRRVKPTNYINMFEWDPAMQYTLTDMGIPVVTMSNAPSPGFNAFSLQVKKSTVGASPKGTGANEWRLMESTEYMYMLNAYIGKLQANLITAEAIEALMIKTKNLHVLDGAKIGAWILDRGMIVSENKRMLLDSIGNSVYLLDETGAPKTIIRPENIAPIDSYFGSEKSFTINLSPLNGGVNHSVSLVITGDEHTSYNVAIPAFDLYNSARVMPDNPNGIAVSGTRVTIDWNQNQIETLAENEVTAYWDEYPGPYEQSKDSGNPSTVRTVKGPGTLTVSVHHYYYERSGNGRYESTERVSNMGIMRASEIVGRSEIGNNGMMVATSQQSYAYMVDNLFQVRKGNTGFRITSLGLQKSTNMNNATPTWSNI